MYKNLILLKSMINIWFNSRFIFGETKLLNTSGHISQLERAKFVGEMVCQYTCKFKSPMHWKKKKKVWTHLLSNIDIRSLLSGPHVYNFIWPYFFILFFLGPIQWMLGTKNYLHMHGRELLEQERNLQGLKHVHRGENEMPNH